MKKILANILFSLGLLFLPATAIAEHSGSHSWFIRMSDPTTSAQQIRTFNIEYTALSTVNTDQISVRLIENGIQIASETTQSGGNSGDFTVTVPSDGQYTYKMQATSSADGTTKTTPEKTVTVETPPEGSTSVVTVTSTGGRGQGGAGGGTAGTASASAATPGDATSGAQNGEGGGQVSDQAATTAPQTDVLGAENRQGQGFFSKDNAPTLVIFLLAALALAYYYFFRRRRTGQE